MTATAERDINVDPSDTTPPGLRRTLLAILVVAVLAIAVAGGYFWGNRSDGSGGTTLPGASSVDAGFARDMATHHQQAVTMAAYERDNSTDADVKLIAFDIESGQSIELGEMTGWLDTWGLSRTDGTPMTWMGSQHMAMGAGGLMPGMATPTQMTKLQTLHGKALDIMFLQLMIHHHQGGIPMAKYAAQYATTDYVRTLAGHMLATQQSENIQMEQLLRQLGGSPLPPPAS